MAEAKSHTHRRGPERSAPRKTRPRQRVDLLLVDRGLVESRARAQAVIMAGLVWSGGVRIEKSGQALPRDANLEVRGPVHPWVSRGGLKLAHALDCFGIDPLGAVALDVGASTGGFTDVLLSRGATRVYAVDVGSGQLAWRLRQDPRVVVLERLNVRHLGREHVPELVDLIVCDVSFIGLEVALPAAMERAKPGATLIALIKPQFEVGRGAVGRKGVVRDSALREEACARIDAWLAARPGWRVLGTIESPITGAEGNREYLIAARFEP